MMPLADGSLPFNVTLSIGQVRFQLTPLQRRPSTTPSQLPPANTTTRHRRRRTPRNIKTNFDNEFERGEYPASNADRHDSRILTIRSSEPRSLALNKEKHHNDKNVSSPRSPVHKYILERVRMAKENSESRAIKASDQQLDNSSTEEGCENMIRNLLPRSDSSGFSVDLHSFTGTLHVAAVSGDAEKKESTNIKHTKNDNLHQQNRDLSVDEANDNLGQQYIHDSELAGEMTTSFFDELDDEVNKICNAKTIYNSADPSVFKQDLNDIVEEFDKRVISDDYEVTAPVSTRLDQGKNIVNVEEGKKNALNRTDAYAEDDKQLSVVVGTDLHQACASDELSHIQHILERDGPKSLFEYDQEGHLPIHILAENESLISKDAVGLEKLVFDMIQLMGPGFTARALHPNTAWLPFVYSIVQWVEQLHDEAIVFQQDISSEPLTVLGIHFPSLETSHATSRSAVITALRNERSKTLFTPLEVVVTTRVCWALCILSRLINEYAEETREAVLSNIANVPLLLKSILLIKNRKQMLTLLQMPIMKHIIMDKRSIDIWLIGMLTSTRESKMRAMLFLKLISQINFADLASKSSSPERYSDKEIRRFLQLRNDAYSAIHNLPGLFPAVLTLRDRAIESLSVTRVMQFVTDKVIRQRKVFFLLMCDLFFDIFLLLGFRLRVEFILMLGEVAGREKFRYNEFLYGSTMGIACYFLVKDILTFWALFRTSKTLAKQYLTNVFNLIDIISVILLLYTGSETTDYDTHGFIPCLTNILLYLKVLGSLKTLNISMALFLYSVVEVVKDIKWFLFFLMSLVVMFADAVRAVMASTGGCNDPNKVDQIQADFCSDEAIHTLVRMYSFLVGQISVDDYQSSPALVGIFCFFSFFCLIVLANILIAIIIESYESSKKRSRALFGKARFEYAAHLVARTELLSPEEFTHAHYERNNVVGHVWKILSLVSNIFSALAIVTVEFGFWGSINFIIHLYGFFDNIISSLNIIYCFVGVIFNVYLLAYGTIGILTFYERKVRRDTERKFCGEWFVKMLKKGIDLFHTILGFNSNSSLEVQGRVTEF